ncbi:hypothetical protein [Usitatibacter palustris]|uniref:Uncharacterized protein n=1 Tax=Usitatibacter palustris TaxID=2732487 RepID=A0A6M4HBC7_9PROT|nr:hypothetical protein [Usitatibacter palustris]QJR16522.1 hypothetical protein DSM104440_03357 [Usitatibacter palustris]
MKSIRLAFAAAACVSAGAVAAPPTVGGCQVFPADNHWNTPVDNLPVHWRSTAWVTSIGNTAKLHADWGNNLADFYGIPFITATNATPPVPILPYSGSDPEDDYSDESDPGPYPIPAAAQVEGTPGATDGDRHVIAINTDDCMLYELYVATKLGGGTSWKATSFAKFNLASNALRTAGWTSADAAGLPIFAGLVRWEEIAAGEINHAIRLTANNVLGRENGQNKYLWPARHWSTSNTNLAFPPMGARFRLKAGFNISTFSAPTQVILRALKKYGFILADRGSNWYFQGVSSASYPNSLFSELGSISGSNFEAVDTALLQVNVNSGQALQGVNGNPARIANISTRGQVLTGGDVMIAGFIVTGTAPKTVVITVAGPSLAAAGITNPLANPVMTLVRASDGVAIASNDNWQSQTVPTHVADIQTAGFAPAHPNEPAIMATLAPGAYTAVVTGAGGTTGVGLVGVYEVDRPDVPVINISTRGPVLTGNDVMIAGFIIYGDSTKDVVVTVAGPSLSGAGIPNPLNNPMLTIVRASDGVVIATNDNWQTQTVPGHVAMIQNAGFAPAHPNEPAAYLTLAPGAYTAVVQGVSNTTGVGLVGVYRVN